MLPTDTCSHQCIGSICWTWTFLGNVRYRHFNKFRLLYCIFCRYLIAFRRYVGDNQTLLTLRCRWTLSGFCRRTWMNIVKEFSARPFPSAACSSGQGSVWMLSLSFLWLFTKIISLKFCHWSGDLHCRKYRFLKKNWYS